MNYNHGQSTIEISWKNSTISKIKGRYKDNIQTFSSFFVSFFLFFWLFSLSAFFLNQQPASPSFNFFNCFLLSDGSLSILSPIFSFPTHSLCLSHEFYSQFYERSHVGTVDGSMVDNGRSVWQHVGLWSAGMGLRLLVRRHVRELVERTCAEGDPFCMQACRCEEAGGRHAEDLACAGKAKSNAAGDVLTRDKEGKAGACGADQCAGQREGGPAGQQCA